MDDLKPCPFCGGPGHEILRFYWGDDCSKWTVVCDNCGAEVSEFDALEQAREAWNRRVTDG